MRRLVPLLLAVLFLGAVIPVLAVSESCADQLDHNRRLVDKYRADPEQEHYARLLRDLRAFQAVPPERQERMRQFDRELHEQDSATQSRLYEVLERYSDWAATSRGRAETHRRGAGPNGTSQRHQEFTAAGVDRPSPQGGTRRAAGLAGCGAFGAAGCCARKNAAAARNGRIGPMAGTARSWLAPNRPARPSDFPTDVQSFVKDQLTPMLSDEEKDHLRRTGRNRWPKLAYTILDLSEKHPVLPPLPAGQIVHYDRLPAEVRSALPQERLKKQKLWDDLQKKDGKWPQYALAAADLMKQEKRTPPPLGASRPADFSAEVRDFIGKLTEADQGKLRQAERRRPDYPLALLDAGRRHDQAVPGMSLPGPRGLGTAPHRPARPSGSRIIRLCGNRISRQGAGQPEPSRRRRRGKA